MQFLSNEKQQMSYVIRYLKLNQQFVYQAYLQFNLKILGAGVICLGTQWCLSAQARACRLQRS